MKTQKNLLIIFTKNPELGKVKTRLAKSIGNEGALKAYLYLLDFTFRITQNLPVSKYIFYDNKVQNEDIWPNFIYQKHLQKGADLGERMMNAFQKGFSQGFSSVVIIGSDCPELTSDIITKAFHYLNSSEVIIGPAKDGGYYLLGMNKLHPRLFINKKWSTSTVFQETIADIKALNLSYATLPILSDVDTEEDLYLLPQTIFE